MSPASADAGNYGDDDVYVRVLYVEGDNSRKAVGAHIWARTVSEEDPEGGGHGYEERTVGPSGIVWFSCPGGGNMLVGAGDLPANSNVGGNGFTGYWDAHNNECGDTITVVGGREYYLPWIHLKEVVPEIETHLSLNRSRIHWRVDLDSEALAYYDQNIDRIVFGSAYDRKFAAAHEFGHAVQEEKMGVSSRRRTSVTMAMNASSLAPLAISARFRRVSPAMLAASRHLRTPVTISRTATCPPKRAAWKPSTKSTSRGCFTT